MSAFDPTSYNTNNTQPSGSAPGGFEGFFIEEVKPYTGGSRVIGVRPITNEKGSKIQVEFELGDGSKESAFCCMARVDPSTGNTLPHQWSPGALAMGSQRLESIYTACGYTMENGVPRNAQGRPDWTGIIGARLNVVFDLWNGRRNFVKASPAG